MNNTFALLKEDEMKLYHFDFFSPVILVLSWQENKHADMINAPIILIVFFVLVD